MREQQTRLVLPVQQNVKWSRFEDGTILVSAIWFRFDTNLIIHHSAHTTFCSFFFSPECKCRQMYFQRILSLCKQTSMKQHLLYLTFRWRQFPILDLGCEVIQRCTQAFGTGFRHKKNHSNLEKSVAVGLRRQGLDKAELPGPRISPYPRPALARHRLPAEPLLGAVLRTGLGLPEVPRSHHRHRGHWSPG